MKGEKILAELSVSEALYFGEIFLEKSTLSQDAVEEVLTFLISNPIRVNRAPMAHQVHIDSLWTSHRGDESSIRVRVNGLSSKRKLQPRQAQVHRILVGVQFMNNRGDGTANHQWRQGTRPINPHAQGSS